jgi:hypothetical protein
MTHQHIELEDTVYFWFASNDTSGSGNDGATPLADVRLAGAAASAAPVLSPTPSLLSHANYPDGCHEVSVAATTANGFAVDNTYGVFCTLAVDSQNPTGFVGSFSTFPIQADIQKVSKDSTAADNLELQYDGTGLTGDEFPSSQAQVGAIGSATGGGLSFEAVGDNTGGALKGVTFVGVETSGTYANTEAEDGVYHNISDTGNAIDIVYQFNIGGARTASEMTFKGYLNSSNDTITIQMYDFVGADWETRGTISGQGGTTNTTATVKFLSKHTGTGADIGTCFVRFVCTAQTSPDFFVDEVVVDAFSEGQSVGYANGAIWIDTVDGTAGTEAYVNGVADKPVDSIADANTISGTVPINRFHLSSDSFVTFAADQSNDEFIGRGYTIALGGQNINGGHFKGAGDITGTGVAATSEVHYSACEFGNVTLGLFHMSMCGLGGTTTIATAGDYTMDMCYSKIPGPSAPVVDMGAAVGATNLAIRGFRGGMTVNNLASGDVLTIGGTLGTVTLNGADATVEIRGTYKALVNNLTGSPTVNVDGAMLAADLAAVQTDTADMQPKLGTPAADISADIAAIPSNVFTSQMTESYAADGTAPTMAQALFQIMQFLHEPTYAGTTLTIKKIDGSTTAMTFTLDDATDPTTHTRTT